MRRLQSYPEMRLSEDIVSNPGVHLSAPPDLVRKCVSQEEIARLRDELDAQGRRLALTNGCFDILHEGHIRSLREAAKLADCLVVALNSDVSVRTLKGEGRPVRGQELRMRFVAELPDVDRVTIFDEVHVTPLLRRVRPHVYVKGGDYTMDTLEGSLREALEEMAVETRFVGHVPGLSTTGILKSLSPGAIAALARGESPPS